MLYVVYYSEHHKKHYRICIKCSLLFSITSYIPFCLVSSSYYADKMCRSSRQRKSVRKIGFSILRWKQLCSKQSLESVFADLYRLCRCLAITHLRPFILLGSAAQGSMWQSARLHLPGCTPARCQMVEIVQRYEILMFCRDSVQWKPVHVGIHIMHSSPWLFMLPV